MSSKARKNNQVLVAYVPVLHEKYRRFFERFPEVKELWLIGRELAYELRPLQKDIRALPAADVKKLLSEWAHFEKIEILNSASLPTLQQTNAQLVFPNDAISRHLVDHYFDQDQVLFDTTFLMWDEKNSLKKNEIQDYSTLSNTEFDQMMMELAQAEADKSDDWWRHVGGVVFKDKTVLLKTHNQHVPTEYEAYYEGDPRANFHKGEYLKVSTAIHVEAYLIAQAAQQGISLEEADMYITTFPCPVCAKQVAYSGIKRVFFRDGYSVLDAERILKDNDVELIQVTGEFSRS